MSQLVIVGGTGYAVSLIGREAVRRGHAVTSYSRRDPAERYDGVENRIGSIADADVVRTAAKEADELANLFCAWAPGEDTGEYRTGGDVWVTTEHGTSEISGVDFARAYVDEIEQRNHVRRRFTVGH